VEKESDFFKFSLKLDVSVNNGAMLNEILESAKLHPEIKAMLIPLDDVEIDLHTKSPQEFINMDDNVFDNSIVSRLYKKFGSFNRLRPFLGWLLALVYANPELVENPKMEPFKNLYQQLLDKFLGISRINVIYNEDDICFTFNNFDIFDGYVPKMNEVLDNVDNYQKLNVPMKLGGLSTGGSKKIDRKILLIGLNGAGKTTLLYKKKLGSVDLIVETIGFNVESIKINSSKYHVWDIAGNERLRSLWNHYLPCDGIIYLVDSTGDIQEARDILIKFLNENLLSSVPVLILGNKQELYNAKRIEEIEEVFFRLKHTQQYYLIHVCSVVNWTGVDEGLSLLDDTIQSIGQGFVNVD